MDADRAWAVGIQCCVQDFGECGIHVFIDPADRLCVSEQFRYGNHETLLRDDSSQENQSFSLFFIIDDSEKSVYLFDVENAVFFTPKADEISSSC